MGGSLAATGLVMSRQAMWLEAIERRITATTAMLSAMKGVKMSGLTNILFATIQDLRREELNISKKFRKLLIWNMAFSKFPCRHSSLHRLIVIHSLHHPCRCPYRYFRCVFRNFPRQGQR